MNTFNRVMSFITLVQSAAIYSVYMANCQITQMTTNQDKFRYF